LLIDIENLSFIKIKTKMKVPYYGLKKSNNKTYENNDYVWVDLKLFLNILTPDIIDKFSDINALKDENWIEKFENKAKQLNFPAVSLG
jgi:hypothetical protein